MTRLLGSWYSKRNSMFKKKSYFVLTCSVFSLTVQFLDAKAPKIQLVETTEENSDGLDNPRYSVDQDVWFGPGFYYGLWFEDEADYWQWRGQHEEFPPNRDYYSHDHPIYYKKGRYDNYWRE